MAHGWSTTPTSALSEYVLGIQPVDAGYQTWLVQPHAGDLAWTEGRAPTRYGSLVVDWGHPKSGQFAMHVSAPRGTSGTIAVPTFGQSVDVRLNGRTVWNNGHAVAHQASAELVDGYVNLEVGSGSYDIQTISSRH